MYQSNWGSNAHYISEWQPAHAQPRFRPEMYHIHQESYSQFSFSRQNQYHRNQDSFSYRRCCSLCSFRQLFPEEKVAIYHSHYSSQQKRAELGIVDDTDPFICDSCKRRHTLRELKNETRRKIIVSDSTLHEFFLHEGYWGDTVHVDYISIGAGFTNHLNTAFRLETEFSDDNRPLDVVLLAGSAEILAGYSREYILEGFECFTNTVLTIGRMKNQHSASTVAIATLMYPPLYCWFAGNGREPYNYSNKLEKVMWLNDKINYLNLRNNAPYYPGLHTYGVRTDKIQIDDGNGNKTVTNQKSHRFPHFMEPSKRDKFTLIPQRKFVAGQAINNYFYERT